MPVTALFSPLTGSPAACAVAMLLCIWATAHVVIVGVALFHPRRSRREEARESLDCHLRQCGGADAETASRACEVPSSPDAWTIGFAWLVVQELGQGIPHRRAGSTSAIRS